jgi:TonB-linked SusC/RagA family outer membrane protein
MKKLSLVLVLFFCALGTMLAQRTITGTITDEAGEALIGASIVVKGAEGVGTTSDIDGSYSLDLPAGSEVLVISYTGYGTKETTLGASNVVNVALAEGSVLGEIVVTGLGIKKEKKALGYAVTTIGSKDIELRPEADVARVLRGKVAGVEINSTSGLAGSGTNVIIRGYSSISGSNQPLFVVDGVPFNSDTNTDRGVLAGSSSASSRFLDLDPNNISEVNVLKGLSATVLYGEAGRNGVILITTKNGADVEMDKKFEVTVQQSVHANQIASLPSDQDLYGNGFHNGQSVAFSNWGAAFDPGPHTGVYQRMFDRGQAKYDPIAGTINHPYDDNLPEKYAGESYPYQAYDNLQNFFQTGLISNTYVNIANQLGEGTTLNFNYGFRSEEGFIPLSTFDKHNFGLGINTNLANGLKVRTTFNYVNSDRVAPPVSTSTSSNPNDGASLFSNVFYTPRSVDLNGLEYEDPTTRETIFYRNGNDITNPYWTLNNSSDNEKLSRFFGTVSVSYDLTDWLSANYRYGIDAYNQRQKFAVNRGGGQLATGVLETSERINLINDHNFNLQLNKGLTDDINLDAVVGFNLRADSRKTTYSDSEQQFLFGLQTHDNYINHLISTYDEDESLLGAFVSASLGYKSYLYLNLAARNDWTSTLEEDNRSVFYPSASVSFVPSEAFPEMTNSGIIDYLKIRIGYGTSAGYPNPYETRSILGFNTREFIRGSNVVNTNTVANQFGNVNLQPELHTELEFGIDAKFWDNRIGLDLSIYDKNSSDLIIPLNLDPTTGFTETTVNAAEISNQGVEIGVNVTPIRRKDLTVSLNGNFTKNVNKVEALSPGLEQFAILELFTTLGSYAIPDQPYGAIQAEKILRDDDGNPIVSGAGTYILDPNIGIVGDPNPDWATNGSISVNYKGFNLSALISYISGGDIYATTPSTLLARGILQETDFDRFVTVVAPGVKEDGTVNDIQITATDHYWTNGGVFIDEMRVYDGTFVKLREVSLSYTLPKKYLENTPFGSASLTFSGQNLWFKALGFPPGSNFDPEVLSTGVGNARGFEMMNVPSSKQWGGSLKFTF